MFNFNAYCFSPSIISENIADPSFFLEQLVGCTVNSNHHVLLDKEERLWLKYLEDSKDNPVAFNNINSWRLTLDAKKSKILFSDSSTSETIDADFISSVAINAPLTCKKYIVTNENELYKNNLVTLISHGVDLLADFNLVSSSKTKVETMDYNPSEFYKDLISALFLVASTRANKLENEHNDYLRDLLSFKGYDVYDQTRLGTSSSGKNTGNLDLIIKKNGEWVTIIEPLRLSSVDEGNIILHYNKLIDNYNPLGLVCTHLVVYFIGNPSGFNDFYKRYKEKIRSMISDSFDSEVEFGTISESDTNCHNVRSFTQEGKINNNFFKCSHSCICFV